MGPRTGLDPRDRGSLSGGKGTPEKAAHEAAAGCSMNSRAGPPLWWCPSLFDDPGREWETLQLPDLRGGAGGPTADPTAKLRQPPLSGRKWGRADLKNNRSSTSRNKSPHRRAPWTASSVRGGRKEGEAEGALIVDPQGRGPSGRAGKPLSSRNGGRPNLLLTKKPSRPGPGPRIKGPGQEKGAGSPHR